VDDAHIIMMGHSMGAGASLGYGSWDPTVDGLVMIAGGWAAAGPYRPRNALFIYAEGDPPSLRNGVRALAAELAGRELSDGEVAGDFAKGTAVAHRMVRHTGHVDIVASDEATRAIVRWLDRVTVRERAVAPGLDDPRLGTAGVGAALLVLVLPGFGLLLAREIGVPLLVDDYHEFFVRNDIELVIELTGLNEVRDEIFRNLPPHIHIIDHVINVCYDNNTTPHRVHAPIHEVRFRLLS